MSIISSFIISFVIVEIQTYLYALSLLTTSAIGTGPIALTQRAFQFTSKKPSSFLRVRPQASNFPIRYMR